jgi:predicted ATPase/DNA-binding SARP family transcriptional activator
VEAVQHELLVEVRVLGPVGLASDVGAIPLKAPKLRRLLAALVVRAGEACSVDVLIDALWEAPPQSSRKLLQLYVSQLRKLLDEPVRLLTDADGYRLELPRDALDSARFESLLTDGRAAFVDGNPSLARSLFERALRLWRGAAYGELAYEPFARVEADRLEELRLVAGEERLDVELALGRHAQLLPEICSLAAANPLRERTQAQAMVALYRCGRQSDALAMFASARRALHDGLGLEPGPDLQELQRHILRHDPRLAAPSQPTATPGLPSPPTRLLGRRQELRELEQLLVADGLRFIVLVGAGGSGKTRLAIEVASRVSGAYANGSRFVELAPLTDTATVIPAIARAVGLERLDADPLEQLTEELRSRELLLVLDNFEHVRDAAPELVSLLAGAPHVTLLVTSRAVLHVSGEHVYPVEPLSAAAAVQLYVERAAALDRRIDDEDEEARAAIDAICQRLDRLPLAVELAAAHARALTPAELLSRLEQRLPLLAGGPRDLPARQLTLEATIAWSAGLLADLERSDLARLSVFSGDWTLDAAHDVCGIDLDRLTTLLDQSLLRRTIEAAGSRYGMLETVREYALESLEASVEATRIRRRHAEYFASLAESAGLYLESERPARHELVRRERENILAALAWALEHREIELGLRIAAALENYWVMRTPFEGVHWLRQFLAGADAVDGTLHARALRALGAAVVLTGEADEGRRLYEKSLREYRSLGDDIGVGILEHRLAFERLRVGDVLGARRMVSRSIRRHKAAGFLKGAALGTGILGYVERSAGHVDSALELFDESLRMANETGYTWWSCQMILPIANLLLEQGRPESARVRLTESIPLLRQIDSRYAAMEALALLAMIESAAKQFERAGRLWGAVRAEEARAPTGLWHAIGASYEGALDERANDAFRRGEAAARELGLAAALDEAERGPA